MCFLALHTCVFVAVLGCIKFNPKIYKVIVSEKRVKPKNVSADITNGYAGIMDEIEMEVDKFILQKYAGDLEPPPPFFKIMWWTQYLLVCHIDGEEVTMKHGEGGSDLLMESK